MKTFKQFLTEDSLDKAFSSASDKARITKKIWLVYKTSSGEHWATSKEVYDQISDKSKATSKVLHTIHPHEGSRSRFKITYKYPDGHESTHDASGFNINVVAKEFKDKMCTPRTGWQFVSIEKTK